MLLLKTRKENLDGVIASSKHATHYLPKAAPGDPVLIAQTKASLDKGEKSVRYIATFQECYKDRLGESVKTWGKPWRYIVKLSHMQEVTPFNLEDIQRSNFQYGPVRTHCALLKEDEQAVLDWLG